MKLHCPKANTWRGGPGDWLSDTGVRPTTPCERLKLCCDSARLHCAPLCTTINTALRCHTVVILWLMRNITIMRLKLFNLWRGRGELHNRYEKRPSVSVNTKVQWAQLRRASQRRLSFKACHCCSIIVHRGVCDCWIMALCILVWLHHQTEWVCALSPSSHEFLCGNRQLWWG